MTLGQEAEALLGDGGEAVFQLLFQNQRKEAAGDVAEDRLIQFVINRPRLEQTLGCAERPLDIP